MYSQLRLANVRAARVVLPQRRLLATPPTLPPSPPPSGTPLVRPVVVVSTPLNTPPTPGSSTLAVPPIPPPAASLPPPPPPPPPRRPRRLRRYFIYTALGVLIFYPVSGYLSTHYEPYREFFTSTFPGGEAVADYADDNGWASLGYGTVQKKAIEGWQKASGEKPSVTGQRIEKGVEDARAKAKEYGNDAKTKAKEFGNDAKTKAQEFGHDAKTKAKEVEASAKKQASKAKAETEKAASNASSVIKEKSHEAKETFDSTAAAIKGAAVSAAHTVSDSAASLKERTAAAVHEAEAKAKALAQEAKAKLHDFEDVSRGLGGDVRNKAEEASNRFEGAAGKAEANLKSKAEEAKTKFQGLASKAETSLRSTAEEVKDKAVATGAAISDNVDSLVKQAEDAIHRGEAAAEDFSSEVGDAVKSGRPRANPDTEKPRQLRPETVKPTGPSIEGKELYKGPPLPLGFEPPPGYYLTPPVVKKEPTPQTLPLLVPKVKEFAAEEPIISQLASTIDSLTASLSTPTTPLSPDATGILTKASDDLSALSKRLDEVKKLEKAKLEKTVGEKTAEFENVLKTKESEWKKGEQGLKEGWEKERQKMVDQWRTVLDGELESQREGIEKRLRDEVVSQGIELQRRWLRSIKTQVETERGGRLAKLDTLSTSLKQLEKITLDNSTQLDDNLKLHKLWSALRAVQAKAEQGDIAFDDELKVLKTLTSNPDVKSDEVIQTTVNQLETSGIASTGIKSFAALSSWFTNSVAPRVHSASLLPAPEESTVLSHLASATLSKILFRPKPSPTDPEDKTVNAILARAEWCLAEKDLDGAAREVNSLQGWAGRLAGDWLREARRRLEVQQALEIVSTEATLSSLLLV